MTQPDPRITTDVTAGRGTADGGTAAPHQFIAAVSESDPNYEWELKRRAKRRRAPKPPADAAQLNLFDRAPVGWFQTPNALTEACVMRHLSPAAVKVYLELRRRKRNGSDVVNPSIGELVTRLGLGKSSVSDALALLESMNMIALERERAGWTGRRSWRITPPAEWAPPSTDSNSVRENPGSRFGQPNLVYIQD